MPMQTLIAVLVVLAATVYLGRRVWLAAVAARRAEQEAGCGSGCGCGHESGRANRASTTTGRRAR